jgi:Domain of unknown function (DUF4190)
VSEVSQGPGWWLASDGRWYPPEQVPGPSAPPVVAAEARPTDGDAHLAAPWAGGPGIPGPAAGYQVPGAVPPAGPGYGPPPGPPGYPPAVDTGFGPSPGPPGYPPPGQPGPPGYGPPPLPPGHAPPMDPGYGYPSAGPLYGYVPVQKTNGLAVASLVCSLVWLGGLGSILAIVFGFMARSQIKRSEGNVQGSGLAVAGIIIGFVGLVAVIFVTIAVIALVHHCDQTGNCTTNTYNFGN